MKDILIGLAVFISLVLLFGGVPYIAYRLIRHVLIKFPKILGVLSLVVCILLVWLLIYGVYMCILDLSQPDKVLGPGMEHHIGPYVYTSTHEYAIHELLRTPILIGYIFIFYKIGLKTLQGRK